MDTKVYNRKSDIDTSKLRAWVEIDLSKFKHNIEVIKRLLSNNAEIIAVVKSEAYGHGALIVSRYLETIGIKYLAVACIEEAIQLRKGGIKSEIIILGWTPICQKQELIEYDLCQTIINSEYAQELSNLPGDVRGYVKVDTGMNRLGESSENLDDIKRIYSLDNLKIEGMFSHLSRADSNLKEDIIFTKKQIKRFNYIIDELKKSNIDVGKTHIQNSYAILGYKKLNYDMVRPGIILYGVSSKAEDDVLYKLPNELQFKAPLSLKCKVSMVKNIKAGEVVGYGNNFTATSEIKVATITIGYADGLSRLIAKKDMKVLVNGEFARQIGNVCMDQMMIDVTGIDVKSGDIVTLIGEDKDKYLPVNQISLLSNTITNETLCIIGARVKRIYHL